jgi:hypothetical protein
MTRRRVRLSAVYDTQRQCRSERPAALAGARWCRTVSACPGSSSSLWTRRSSLPRPSGSSNVRDRAAGQRGVGGARSRPRRLALSVASRREVDLVATVRSRRDPVDAGPVRSAGRRRALLPLGGRAAPVFCVERPSLPLFQRFAEDYLVDGPVDGPRTTYRWPCPERGSRAPAGRRRSDAINLPEATAELHCSGTQFDPVIVRAFFEVSERRSAPELPRAA